MREIDRVLIVEDDPTLMRSLRAILSERFREVRSAASLGEALRELRAATPDLLLLDVVLPDGSALDVLREVEACRPFPLVIAMSGAASADQSFALAQLGVRTFLPKPLTRAGLDEALERAASTSPELEPLIRASVGERSLTEVEREVRETMVREALDRSHDNRRGAARLLSISRQMLQHILRRDPAP